MMPTFIKISIFLFVLGFTNCANDRKLVSDVIIIGDGTGAISSAIQSSRSGAKTILITSIPWLGGMLTSAGVSAIDGNHQLPSGIWGEFRDSIYAIYGGPDKVATGWVSNTHFEPHVGNKVFQNMAKKETNLQVIFNQNIVDVTTSNGGWIVSIIDQKSKIKSLISGTILIDGTDLGDIAQIVDVRFDVGMELQGNDYELIGPVVNDVIQDLTYVAILEESKVEPNESIVPSKNYDPSIFYCACEKLCIDEKEPTHPCDVMLNYAKLPNNKYLINWPIHGNDYYVNVIEKDEKSRNEEFQKAKQKTIDFIYFIQHELGYTNLTLSKSEFPTVDLFPFLPYHREGRRIHGKVRFTSKHIKNPEDYLLHRTGIAVGDYPIDHHHKERQDLPRLEFPSVPSFSIPIGTLIPQEIENFIVADKSISVSNIANGSTRLQPVILQIGQVAGYIAAYAIAHKIHPSKVNIRAIQGYILKNGGYISPFKDLPKTHFAFSAAQRIAVCDLIDLEGRPYKWANETLLHPNEFMDLYTAQTKLLQFFGFNHDQINKFDIEMKISDLDKLFQKVGKIDITEEIITKNLLEIRKLNRSNLAENENRISRIEYIFIIDKLINPFGIKDVDFEGNWIN